MTGRWGWVPAAFVGVLLGFAAGLGMESFIDPAGKGSDAGYGDSTRLLFILRYVGLGLVAAIAIWALSDRRQRNRSSGSGAAFAAVMALGLVVVAGIYPVFTEEDEPVPANVREVFQKNCRALTAEDKSVTPAEGARYCGCLVTTLAKGRSPDEFEKLLAESNRSLVDGKTPPDVAVAAAAKCVKQTKILG